MPLSSLLQDILLALAPAGGQQTARRNAWAGMSRDAAASRDRREAEAAVAALGVRRRRSTGTRC